jgi:hypothetical protein
VSALHGDNTLRSIRLQSWAKNWRFRAQACFRSSDPSRHRSGCRAGCPGASVIDKWQGPADDRRARYGAPRPRVPSLEHPRDPWVDSPSWLPGAAPRGRDPVRRGVAIALVGDSSSGGTETPTPRWSTSPTSATSWNRSWPPPPSPARSSAHRTRRCEHNSVAANRDSSHLGEPRAIRGPRSHSQRQLGTLGARFVAEPALKRPAVGTRNDVASRTDDGT